MLLFSFCCILAIHKKVYDKWLFIITFLKKQVDGTSSIWYYKFSSFLHSSSLAIYWFLWHDRDSNYF